MAAPEATTSRRQDQPWRIQDWYEVKRRAWERQWGRIPLRDSATAVYTHAGRLIVEVR